MASAQSAGEPRPDARPRRPRIRRLLHVAVLLLGAATLLAALAPTILSLDAVRPHVLRAASARLPILVEASNLSLSWFGSQHVEGLVVRLDNGANVATARRVSLKQGLADLLQNHRHIGAIHISDAEVWTDGLARACQAIAGKQSQAGKPAATRLPDHGPPPFPDSVDLQNATVRAGGRTLSIPSASFKKGDGSGHLEVSVEFSGADSGTANFDAAIDGLWADWRGWQNVGGRSRVKFSAVPLSMIAAIVADFGLPIEAGGTLSGEADVRRDRDGSLAVCAALTGKDLWATGPFLNGDRPSLENLNVTADGCWAGRVLTVRVFELKAPVASVTGSGVFAVAPTAAQSPGGRGSANATVYAARLAKMFPRTFGLQSDLEITGGTIEASIDATDDQQATVFAIRADVKDLEGTRNGRHVVVSPGRLVAEVVRPRTHGNSAGTADANSVAADRPIEIRRLEATGGFGSVHGAGRLDGFVLEGNVNLAEASAEVARFVDLGGYSLGGQAAIHLTTQGDLRHSVRMTAEFVADGAEASFGPGRRLSAARAGATAELEGNVAGALRALAGASANCGDVAPNVSMSVRKSLKEVVIEWEDGLRFAADAVTAELHLRGNQARPSCINSHVAIVGKSVAVARNKGASLPPVGTRPTHDVLIDLTASVDADGTVRVSDARVRSSGLTATAKGAVRLHAKTGSSFLADGTFSASADLAEIQKLVGSLCPLPADLSASGKADFDFTVSTSGDAFSGSGRLNLSNMRLTDAKGNTVLDEPRALMPVRLAYDTRTGRWDLAVEDFSSRLATGTVRTSVVPNLQAWQVSCQCGMTCDGAGVRSLLGSAVPADLRFSGYWRVSAAVAGPMPAEGAWNRRLADLQGSATIDVATVSYDRIAAGQGTIGLQLTDGRLILTAAEGQANRLRLVGGAVTLAGSVNLRQTPPRFVLTEPVRVIDGVPMSDPGVRRYAKFGSPVLAASIDPAGRVFVDADALDISLASGQPARHAGAGRFWIDDFQAELTGPLAMLLSPSDSPVRTPAQRLGPVSVRLADGWLYLQEHQLVFGSDAVMRFKGRIGLDGRMDIEVNIPLTAPMLRRFGASASAVPYLVGQRLTVPLTGTVDKPHLDEKVVARRVAEMALEAARRHAIRELGDWLRKSVGGP